MNVNEYIASGILEEYVMGLLDENQQQEVVTIAAQHPEVRAELDKIESVLEGYAQAKAIAPPSGLMQGILEQIGADVLPHTSSDIAPKSKSGKLWSLAALGLGIASLALGYAFYQSNQKLANVKNELAVLDEECKEASADYQRTIAILRNPESKLITMAGTEANPDAATRIYIDKNRQTAFLDVLNLPEAPSDKDYQLWAIVDGNPVDMGIVPIASNQVIVPAPYIENASAYAITLERKGGSPTPTLSAMVVIGEVG